MLAVPWPKEVLQEFDAREPAEPAASVTGASAAAAVAGARQQTAGRGRPAIKIGLADGVPNSIMPDHLVSNACKRLLLPARASWVQSRPMAGLC